MSIWYQSSFFKYAIGTILVLLIVLLLYQTSFLFRPVIEFVTTLFFPILLAGVLYYILRPFVRVLERLHITRGWAIFIVYFCVLLVLMLVAAYVVPILADEFTQLTTEPTEKIKLVKEKTMSLMNFINFNFYSSAELKEMFTAMLYKINELIRQNIVETVTTVAQFAVLIFITPFILFYFLKDDRSLNAFFLQITPIKYQKETRLFFRDIDRTLSTFITGQLTIAVAIGSLLLIGYLIIGLQSAFILALFATAFVIIPILGSFIAIIPAMLVGLIESPWMAFKVVLVMLAAHLLEGNFISPQIMGKRLHIHPLVLMLILLASGTLYGVLGLFLATPIYAILRVVVVDFVKVYQHGYSDFGGRFKSDSDKDVAKTTAKSPVTE